MTHSALTGPTPTFGTAPAVSDDAVPTAVDRGTASPVRRFPWRRVLPAVAGLLVALAMFLPLWGMTLISVQYPEALRMVVYTNQLVGDVQEINLLNHYVGMSEISIEYFGELQIIRYMFLAIAALCGLYAFVRRPWFALLPLGMMAGSAVFGFSTMARRLYEYGHNLDPAAAMKMTPFTPPMFGMNEIAQFGTYSYFSWGTICPLVAGGLIFVTLVLDIRDRRDTRHASTN